MTKEKTTGSRFISREEAQRLVESGFTRCLSMQAEEISRGHRESLTEAGYAQAMREYGVSRDQVNPMWVQNEYVRYHSHGNAFGGDDGQKAAMLVEAYAAGELVMEAEGRDLVPLTQERMENWPYPYGHVWNPARQGGNHVGSGWVPYGNFQHLSRKSLAKVAQEYHLWHDIDEKGVVRAAGSRGDKQRPKREPS